MKKKTPLPKDNSIYGFIKEKSTLIASLSEHSYVRVVDGCDHFAIIVKPMDLNRNRNFNITDGRIRTVTLLGNGGDVEIVLEYVK